MAMLHHLFLTFAISFVLAFVPAKAEAIRILALGDSLTAGFGVDPQDAFPAQLERALQQAGQDVVVLNAGVSGDTAVQGAARLEWALADGADAVIIELGANDALRGLPPEQAEAALRGILETLQSRNIPALLSGMRAPPNLGPDYAAKFDAMYPRLATEFGVLLDPFFLEGVAADPTLNQSDGLHPTTEGIAKIVERLVPQVSKLTTRRAK